MCSFKALSIPTDESTLDEFVHVDDENSEEFFHEILDDVNEVLESMQATNDNEDENVHTVVKCCARSPAPTENMSLFVSLNTYTSGSQPGVHGPPGVHRVIFGGP